MMVRYILQMLPECFFNRTGRVFSVFVLVSERKICVYLCLSVCKNIREIRSIRVQKIISVC